MIQRFEQFTSAIFEISRCWHKLAEEELSVYGLKGPYATYLTVMYRHEDGITGPELCQLCGRDKSDLSRAVAMLREKGLVVKEAVDQSLYRGLLKLTEQGRIVAGQISRRASLAVEMAGRDLSEESRETFYKALFSIAGHLREISREGLPKQ
ncbi:MAG: MarR family transcriptional regulator [Oscillibacter sp.]|nr:MarR family transcriptional regulator [Oscillibacter sp.]